MSNQIKLLLLGAILAAVFFLIFFLDKNFLITKLNEYNLLPKPERFTELYFENHAKLPKQIIATEEAKFKFTVHNLEYEPVTYDYKIEAISTESAKLLKEGKFTLNHDDYKSIGGSISSVEIQIRTKVNVSLENKNQSIHFWVNGN